MSGGCGNWPPETLRRVPVFRMGQDPGVACQAHGARTLWLLGYPAQALTHIHDALALAHELTHPFSVAFAQCWAAIVSQLRRDVLAVYETRRGRCHALDHPGISTGGLRERASWVGMALQAQSEAGIAQVRQRITALRATGVAILVPYLCTLLAEVDDHLGHTADGLQAWPSTPWWSSTRNAGGKRKPVASRASCS